MVLKFDLTNASGKPPSAPVRDEKFSLDTFYSQMKAERQSDYTTTQEEASEGGLHQRQIFR